MRACVPPFPPRFEDQLRDKQTQIERLRQKLQSRKQSARQLSSIYRQKERRLHDEATAAPGTPAGAGGGSGSVSPVAHRSGGSGGGGSGAGDDLSEASLSLSVSRSNDSPASLHGLRLETIPEAGVSASAPHPASEGGSSSASAGDGSAGAVGGGAGGGDGGGGSVGLTPLLVPPPPAGGVAAAGKLAPGSPVLAARLGARRFTESSIAFRLTSSGTMAASALEAVGRSNSRSGSLQADDGPAAQGAGGSARPGASACGSVCAFVGAPVCCLRSGYPKPTPSLAAVRFSAVLHFDECRCAVCRCAVLPSRATVCACVCDAGWRSPPPPSVHPPRAVTQTARTVASGRSRRARGCGCGAPSAGRGPVCCRRLTWAWSPPRTARPPCSTPSGACGGCPAGTAVRRGRPWAVAWCVPVPACEGGWPPGKGVAARARRVWCQWLRHRVGLCACGCRQLRAHASISLAVVVVPSIS
jgi:hypothetical protein